MTNAQFPIPSTQNPIPKMISWQDFENVDIRTGTVIDVQDFPEARKPAFKLTIDFGELGIKRSSAQITDLYRKEDLLNRQIVAVVNFPPKQIATFWSECLVLGVAVKGQGVVLLQTECQTANGLKIS